jgi:surfeit locus 1 family protein
MRIKMRLIAPLLFGLAGAAILISLGVWQLQRLEWKENILAQINERLTSDPVGIPLSANEADDEYLPVKTDGVLHDNEIHVLVSQKRVGAGYRVISSFVTNDGRTIMVDRGFIKTEQKNDSRPTGPVQITGTLHWPNETGSSIPEPDRAKNIWFARDVPTMAAALNTDPVLVISRETSFADDPVQPLPVDSSAIPNDHLQYAITWFSLALVWITMTITFIWRSRAASKG